MATLSNDDALHRKNIPIALLDLAENFYERCNRDIATLYQHCQISEEQAQRRQKYLSGWQFQELNRCCLDIAVPDIPLSVQLADCIPITVSGGMFGVASFTAKNIQQALEIMIDYAHTIMPAYRFEGRILGDKYHVELVPILDFGDMQGHIDESVTGYFLNLRNFCKLTAPPIQVHLTHAPFGEISDYENHFRAKYLFSQKKIEIILGKHHLKTPLITHNRETFDEVYQRLKTEFGQTEAESASNSVINFMQECLTRGRSISLTKAADAMNMSERTLARHLQQEGNSFANLKQEVSINHAKVMLAKTNYPISRIADMCGYNTDSNFSRAFKNVTGLTPKQYRNQHID